MMFQHLLMTGGWRGADTNRGRIVCERIANRNPHLHQGMVRNWWKLQTNVYLISNHVSHVIYSLDAIKLKINFPLNWSLLSKKSWALLSNENRLLEGKCKKVIFLIYSHLLPPPFLESFAHEFFLNKTSWFCCPQKVVKEKFLHFAEVDKTMRFAEATMSEFFLPHKVGFFCILPGDGLQCQWPSFQKWNHFIEWALRVMLEEGAETHCQYLENLPTTSPPSPQSHSQVNLWISLSQCTLYLFLREPERNMYFAASSV